MTRVKNKREKYPLIIIKCEGTNSAEKIYFRNFSRRDCRIKFCTGNRTDVKGMLEDLLNYMVKEDLNIEDNNQIYLVLDTDFNQKRIKEINEIEPICQEKGINIILSSPTFEMWYLLHFRHKNIQFKSSKEVKKEIKKLIPEYKETLNIYLKLKDKTKEAIKNAKIVKKQDYPIEFKPYSNIYIILEDIEKLTKEKL